MPANSITKHQGILRSLLQQQLEPFAGWLVGRWKTALAKKHCSDDRLYFKFLQYSLRLSHDSDNFTLCYPSHVSHFFFTSQILGDFRSHVTSLNQGPFSGVRERTLGTRLIRLAVLFSAKTCHICSVNLAEVGEENTNSESLLFRDENDFLKLVVSSRPVRNLHEFPRKLVIFEISQKLA